MIDPPPEWVLLNPTTHRAHRFRLAAPYWITRCGLAADRFGWGTTQTIPGTYRRCRSCWR